jgi:hypothetical protein
VRLGDLHMVGRPYQSRSKRARGHTQMANLHNLSRRPARPSLNRGPVQRRAKRALWALGIASTSQVATWTHARARVQGLCSDNHTRSARRVLERIAVRVERLSPTLTQATK